jgi:hypothetical protein
MLDDVLDKLEYVYSHEEEAKQVGLRGADFAKQNFDKAVVAAKVAELLKSAATTCKIDGKSIDAADMVKVRSRPPVGGASASSQVSVVWTAPLSTCSLLVHASIRRVERRWGTAKHCAL